MGEINQPNYFLVDNELLINSIHCSLWSIKKLTLKAIFWSFLT